MTLRVQTPTVLGDPVGGLVTLAKAKAQLRIDQDDTEDDETVEDEILTATQWVESHVQRRYLEQTLEWVLPFWPCPFRLPIAPATEVESITYVDATGAQQTWPSNQYVVSPSGETLSIRPRRGVVFPMLDPDAAEAVVVTFKAGRTLADVPHGARQAALLTITDLHDNRGGAGDGLSDRAKALLLDETWS